MWAESRQHLTHISDNIRLLFFFWNWNRKGNSIRGTTILQTTMNLIQEQAIQKKGCWAFSVFVKIRWKKTFLLNQGFIRIEFRLFSWRFFLVFQPIIQSTILYCMIEQNHLKWKYQLFHIARIRKTVH